MRRASIISLICSRCTLVAMLVFLAPDTALGSSVSATDTLIASAPGPVEDELNAHWLATIYHGFERFDSDRPSWQSDALIVGWRSSRGTAGFVELGSKARHGQSDPFGAIDLYRPIGVKAHVNLRFALAPGSTISPRADVYLESFRAMASGFEASAGYRFSGYSDAKVHTVSMGIAKYLGNWYLRVKNSATPINGSVGYAVVATGRRYFSGANEFVGVTVANGREIVGLPGGAVLSRTSLSGSIYGQRFFTRHAGLRLSVDIVRDGDLSRWGMSAGVVATW